MSHGKSPIEELERAAGIEALGPEELEAFPDKQEDPVLVVFLAPWCEVCMEAVGAVAACAGRLREESVKVLQVDVDRADRGVERLGVRSVPTLVLFANGGEQGRVIGLRNEEALVEFVKEALEDIRTPLGGRAPSAKEADPPCGTEAAPDGGGS